MRRVSNSDSVDPHVIPFSLSAGIGWQVLTEFDVLIHCAYDFRPTQWSDIERVNVVGSQRVVEAAVRAGVSRIILISTMSAFDNCRSMYGNAKLTIEAIAEKHGAVIVRPGLVYGPKPGGMVGALQRVVSRFSLVPVIGGAPLYLTHQNDLAELIWRACKGEISPVSPISAVSEHPLNLARILSLLGDANGKRIVLLPVPAILIWVMLKALEKLGIRAGFRSDSLVSLLYQNPTPSFESARKTGVKFRDFSVETLRS